MPAASLDSPRRDLRVRLVADTVSVPGARRFVTDGLTDWGMEGLVDDAALCVTEMAANAALHSGSRYMDVVVRDLDGRVELAVVDQGGGNPVEAIGPRTVPATGLGGWQDVRTTGRGLAIVSMLAKDWGITEAAGRRRIWATLVPGGDVGPVRPPRRRSDVTDAAEVPDVLPPGWRLVVVPQAPVDLSLRLDNHLDEVVSELRLIDSRPGSPSASMAALIRQLVSVPFARSTAVQHAVDAAETGATHVDVRLPMPRQAAGSLRRLLTVLRQADDLCRSHELLAVPSTEEMDLLRAWFTHNMVTQLEDDADPVLYDDWLERPTG